MSLAGLLNDGSFCAHPSAYRGDSGRLTFEFARPESAASFARIVEQGGGDIAVSHRVVDVLDTRDEAWVRGVAAMFGGAVAS